MSISIGDKVAFKYNTMIAFGVLRKKTTTEDKNGETTEFMVEHFTGDEIREIPVNETEIVSQETSYYRESELKELCKQIDPWDEFKPAPNPVSTISANSPEDEIPL